MELSGLPRKDHIWRLLGRRRRRQRLRFDSTAAASAATPAVVAVNYILFEENPTILHCTRVQHTDAQRSSIGEAFNPFRGSRKWVQW